MFARETIGIGVALEITKPEGELRIIKIIPESPAAKANLSEGLIIIHIDGVATSGKSLSQCVDLLRGPTGTHARLQVITTDRQTIINVEVAP